MFKDLLSYKGDFKKNGSFYIFPILSEIIDFPCQPIVLNDDYGDPFSAQEHFRYQSFIKIKICQFLMLKWSGV